MNNFIETKNLCKSFFVQKEEVKALIDINLTVQYEEVLVITGPSGSGKSTLLHLLGLMDTPTKGEIIFEDRPVSTLSEKEMAKIRNKTIGFVFQFHHLLPEFNAFENVILPGYIHNENLQKTKEYAHYLLDRFGLSERKKHFPSQLSGGEQQRVSIARALINQPKLLLADEPTGNLDYQTGKNILELLTKYVRENNMTLVLVTHNPELKKLADRTLTLFAGRLDKQVSF